MRGSPVRNTSSGIFRLVAKLLPGSVVRPRPRAILNSSSPLAGRRQHDEPTLGAADLDGRVQHQRQHVVEDAARAEGAQPLEQDGNLPQIADRRGRGALLGGDRVGQQEHHLRPARPSEADAVAVRERPLGDLLPVHIGAVAGVAIAKDEIRVLNGDFGVIARDLTAGEPEVVRLATADFELPLGNWHDAPTEGIGHFETGVRHGESLMEDPRNAKAVSTAAQDAQ